MRLSLSKKIVAPYALLGVLVLVLVAVMFIFDGKLQSAAREERALLKIGSSVREISSRVQSGILTRKEQFAVDASKAALESDEYLIQLGASGESLRQQFEDFFAAVVAINSVFQENRMAEGEKRLDQLRDQENRIKQNIDERLAATQSVREKLSVTAKTFQIAVLIAIVVTVALVVGFVMRSIVKPITDMRSLINGIAQGEGDLTARLKVNTDDEIRDIAEAFNVMMGKLQDIMRFVIEASRDVAREADALAASMTQTTQGTLRQSEAAAATAATVEQVTVSISQVSGHAGEAEKVAVEADILAQEGRKAADLAATQIAETAEAVSKAATHITALSERSEQIRSIVGVISEIASQTNLLALNAAIEAARAGEQGRGFAVVADEVRKLAERTSVATGEIASMIDAIGKDVGNAVEMIRESSQQEKQEVVTAENLRDVLERISQAVDRSTEHSRDIARATREQAQAAEAVAQNVETIARMSDEINAASTRSEDTAQAMRNLASKLHQHVGRFRI